MFRRTIVGMFAVVAVTAAPAAQSLPTDGQIQSAFGIVYHYAAERLEVQPQEMAPIAGHLWDMYGAAAAGFTTAYLIADRPFSRVMRKPDLEGSSLVDLAQQLLTL